MLDINIDLEELEVLNGQSAKSVLAQLITTGTAHTKDNYINNIITIKLPELRRPKNDPKVIMANDRRSKFSVISFNLNRYDINPENDLEKDIKKMIKIFK